MAPRSVHSSRARRGDGCTSSDIDGDYSEARSARIAFVSIEKKGTWVSKLPDADMQSAPRALLRAAQRAREVARATHTPLVIVVDGVLTQVPWDQIEDIDFSTENDDQ